MGEIRDPGPETFVPAADGNIAPHAEASGIVDVRAAVMRTAAGKIHAVAVTASGNRLTGEACNLDDVAGELAEITQAELEAADADSLCGHCFDGAR